MPYKFIYTYMYIDMYICICHSSFVVLTVMCSTWSVAAHCCCWLFLFKLIAVLCFSTVKRPFFIYYWYVFWNASFIYIFFYFTTHTPFVYLARRIKPKTTTTNATCAQSVCRAGAKWRWEFLVVNSSVSHFLVSDFSCSTPCHL